MNKVFAEHVTNTAFFLSISKRQIESLLLHDHFDMETRVGRHACFEADRAMGYGSARPMDFIATERALAEKGLGHRVPIKEGEGAGSVFVLTEAGRIVCKLLREAGFSLPLHVVQEKAA